MTCKVELWDEGQKVELGKLISGNKCREGIRQPGKEVDGVTARAVIRIYNPLDAVFDSFLEDRSYSDVDVCEANPTIIL